MDRLAAAWMLVLAAGSSALADRIGPESNAGAVAHRTMTPPMQPPPTPMPPPAEIAALGKQLAGAYTCKGVTFVGDGSSTPIQAKLDVQTVLGGAWVEMSLTETKADGLRYFAYRTFDPIAKQWTLLEVTSTAGHVTATSLGERGGEWTWDGSAVSSAGSMQLKMHERRDGKNLKLFGEALMSGSWGKLYDVTCTR